MALVDLVMPKLGESIMEATILKWFKKPGDAVKQDETVLEIATDKVDSEVPCTSEGVFEEMLFQVNDVVPIGAVIARIRTQDGDAHAENKAPLDLPHAANTQTSESKPSQNLVPPSSNGSGISTRANHFYSPLVLNIAANIFNILLIN